MVRPSLEAVAECERSMWRAASERQFAVIAGYLADDYVGVYEPGVKRTRDEVLAGLDALHVESAELDDLAVKGLGPEIAQVSYRLTVRGSVDGATLHAACLASAIWCFRDGRWLNVYYQETPIEGGL